MKKRNLLYILFFIFFLFDFPVTKAQEPVLTRADSAWVDTLMNSMSLERKISQLMIIRAFSTSGQGYEDSLVNTVKTWEPGGICFFKGTPSRQAILTNRLQEDSYIPLLISIDAEWGLAMRLDSTTSFPRQMTLGAIADNSLIYEMASAIAKECRRLGIQMNFAPVVDVNNNPANPVIGSRSFGEDKYAVARKGIAYMHGLQDHGILSVAKHFPGHGDTDTDSHLALPVVPFSSDRIYSLELYPFRELVSAGIDGIMTGHLYVPALDSMRIPATLSPRIVSRILRGRLAFDGLSITDALDMKGVTNSFKPGLIEVKALLAGNDVLLLPVDIGIAVKAICQAIDSGLITLEEIDLRCRKILMMKAGLGLTHASHIKIDSLVEELNPVSNEVLKSGIYKAAVTIVKNENNLIPLNFLEFKKIAVLSIGGDTLPDTFQEIASEYASVKMITLPLFFDSIMMNEALDQLKDANIVIVGVHTITNLASRRFGIPEEVSRLIDTISVSKRVILDIFGSPYSLSLVDTSSAIETIIISYQNEPLAEKVSAEMIFGGVAASAHLPVTGSSLYPLDSGIETRASRFEYIIPEEAGIASEDLYVIDSIASLGIANHAYPGCQIIFAKDGKVFYNKSFGTADYDEQNPVNSRSIYDLASLTKALATTLDIMHLYDQGKIKLDEKLGTYLPELANSNKEGLTIRAVMTHQAGLQPWIPFFEKTMSDGKLIPGIYDTVQSPGYPDQVAKNLFIRKDYRDSVFSWIVSSPLRPVKDYKYSDLGFYLLARIIERVSGQNYAKFTDSVFYRPLGLQTTGFYPLSRFPEDRIMPTEDDHVFRKQLIRGYVHDPGAAMLGGASGHAGLFSDASDIAIILQMLLNGGEYGGRQYLIPSTIKEFTRVQFALNNNRRGIGFDKPPAEPSPDGPVCASASPSSFGHSGFTGTYFWADPENGLLYVFLSNRVFPDASNQKLAGMNIRTSIHQRMYEILKQSRKH